MSVEEIKSAIDKLPFEERARLMRLLFNWQDDEWDRQIAADVAAGKLDKLFAEVDEDIKTGRLREMP